MLDSRRKVWYSKYTSHRACFFYAPIFAYHPLMQMISREAEMPSIRVCFAETDSIWR